MTSALRQNRVCTTACHKATIKCGADKQSGFIIGIRLRQPHSSLAIGKFRWTEIYGRKQNKGGILVLYVIVHNIICMQCVVWRNRNLLLRHDLTAITFMATSKHYTAVYCVSKLSKMSSSSHKSVHFTFHLYSQYLQSETSR